MMYEAVAIYGDCPPLTVAETTFHLTSQHHRRLRDVVAAPPPQQTAARQLLRTFERTAKCSAGEIDDEQSCPIAPADAMQSHAPYLAS